MTISESQIKSQAYAVTKWCYLNSDDPAKVQVSFNTFKFTIPIVNFGMFPRGTELMFH